jgi:hypothetical protein
MTYLGEANNDRKHLCYTIGRFQKLAKRSTSLHCQKPHWVLICNHTWIFMLWIYCMGLKCQTIMVHTELQFSWFTMLNMASSVGQHTIRQMPHDYHNHHQSVSITLGSESTVVSLVLKPLIQRQFTYTEDSSEHKLLKTIKESWDFQKKYQTKNWCAYVRDFDRHQLINMDNVSTRERFYSFAHSYSLPRPSPQM